MKRSSWLFLWQWIDGDVTYRGNHKSLTHLQDQTLVTELQRKAMAKLSGLQFQIQYRKGVENKAADALSRVAHQLEFAALSVCTPMWVQEVLKSYGLECSV